MLLVEKATHLVKCYDCFTYKNTSKYLNTNRINKICFDCHKKRDEIEENFNECPICYSPFDRRFNTRIGLIDIEPLEKSKCLHYICKNCFRKAFKTYYYNNENEKIKCPLCRCNWNDLAKHNAILFTYGREIGELIGTRIVENGIIISYVKSNYGEGRGFIRLNEEHRIIANEIGKFLILRFGYISPSMRFLDFIKNKSNYFICSFINFIDRIRDDDEKERVYEFLLYLDDENKILDYINDYFYEDEDDIYEDEDDI